MNWLDHAGSHLYNILEMAKLYGKETAQWSPGVRASRDFGGAEGTLPHLDPGRSDTTVCVKLAGLRTLRVGFMECKLHLNLELKKNHPKRRFCCSKTKAGKSPNWGQSEGPPRPHPTSVGSQAESTATLPCSVMRPRAWRMDMTPCVCTSAGGHRASPTPLHGLC